MVNLSLIKLIITNLNLFSLLLLPIITLIIKIIIINFINLIINYLYNYLIFL
jgi:hypothetical protein